MPRLKDHDEMYLRDFIRDSRKSIKKPNRRRNFFLDLLESALNRDKKQKAHCLDCDVAIEPEAEVDIQLCEQCMKNYDVDKLWKMHDNRELDALDFNENPWLRKMLKIKKEVRYD